MSIQDGDRGFEEARQREVDMPSSPVIRFGPDKPLKLDAGVDLTPWQIAYQTYGTLNARRSNAILVCHALTGDQHVANRHPVTGKPGWWSLMVGPGRPIDTDRYFVICSNVLGGCMGTTGPASSIRKPASPMRSTCRSSPSATWCARRRCCSTIWASRRCFASTGGSMGGMQVLQWAASYPERVFAAHPDRRRLAPFLAEHRLPRGRPPGDHGRSRLARRPLSGRQARPAKGLAVARMAAHITYLSDEALHRKFGRSCRTATALTFGFDADFQIEILSAPPGHDLCRPVRRQFLSLHDPGDGLFRPGRGAMTAARQGVRRLPARVFAASRSPPTGCFRRRKPQPSSMRSTPPAPMSPSSRSRPTAAMTPSCSTSRRLFKTIRGFLTGAARVRGIDDARKRRRRSRRLPTERGST